jgi:hypothetical protein
MCNDLDLKDIVVKGTDSFSVFCKCDDALGPSMKFQTHSTSSSNGTYKDFVPDKSLHYDCCEHVGSKINLNITKGMQNRHAIFHATKPDV